MAVASAQSHIDPLKLHHRELDPSTGRLRQSPDALEGTVLVRVVSGCQVVGGAVPVHPEGAGAIALEASLQARGQGVAATSEVPAYRQFLVALQQDVRGPAAI